MAALWGFWLWEGDFAHSARHGPPKLFFPQGSCGDFVNKEQVLAADWPLLGKRDPLASQNGAKDILFVQWPATNLGSGTSRESWWTQLTAPIRQGAKKITSFFTESVGPRTEPTYKADAISLSRPARASPQLYVALARLAEQRGRFDEAEQHYRRALEIAPSDLDALLGFARLKDRLNEPETAAQLYRKALSTHPRESAVYNDYALYLARRGDLLQASKMMEEAIRLQPRRWLYRTNMAVILLELGQPEAALAHLQAVQDSASACYNLGYLAYRKGDIHLAVHYFGRALEFNPHFEPARQWLDQLARSQAVPAPGTIPQASFFPEYGPSAPDPAEPIAPYAASSASSLPIWTHVSQPGGSSPPALTPPQSPAQAMPGLLR